MSFTIKGTTYGFVLEMNNFQLTLIPAVIVDGHRDVADSRMTRTLLRVNLLKRLRHGIKGYSL